MPLSEAGNKILHNMVQEYGSKKGKKVFYSKENMGGKFSQIVKKHSRMRKRYKK